MEHPRSPTRYLDRDLPPLPSLPPPKPPAPLQIRKISANSKAPAPDIANSHSLLNINRTPSPKERGSRSLGGSTTQYFPPQTDSVAPTSRPQPVRLTNSSPRHQRQRRDNNTSPGRSNSDASSSIFGNFRALSPSKQAKSTDTVGEWLGNMSPMNTATIQQSWERKNSDAVEKVQQVLRDNPLQEEFPSPQQMNRFLIGPESGYPQNGNSRNELNSSPAQDNQNTGYSPLSLQESQGRRSRTRMQAEYIDQEAFAGRSALVYKDTSRLIKRHPFVDSRTNLPTKYGSESSIHKKAHLNHETFPVIRGDSELLRPGEMPLISEQQSRAPVKSGMAKPIYASDPTASHRIINAIETESYHTWAPNAGFEPPKDGSNASESVQDTSESLGWDGHHGGIHEEIDALYEDNELRSDPYHDVIRKQAFRSKKNREPRPEESGGPAGNSTSTRHGSLRSLNSFETHESNERRPGPPAIQEKIYETPRKAPRHSEQSTISSLRSSTPLEIPSGPRSVTSHAGILRVQYDLDEQALHAMIQENPNILRAVHKVHPMNSQEALGVQVPHSATTGAFGRSTVVVDVSDTPPARTRSPMKELFGPRGFFGVTGPSPAKNPDEKHRKKGMGAKLKELTTKAGLSPKKSSAPFPAPVPVQAHNDISVTRDKQATMYMELELCLCTTANNFLMVQLHEHRIGELVAKRAAEWWRQKGRPDVIEFQYDQATQRDIIVAHQKRMQFYGQNSYNSVSRNTVFQSWKRLAKEMSTRYFCAPDHVIDHHLQDALAILEMLGATAEILSTVGEMLEFLNNQVEVKEESRQNPGLESDSPPLLWDPESPFLACQGQQTPKPFTPSQLRIAMSAGDILQAPNVSDMAPGHKGFGRWRKHLNI